MGVVIDEVVTDVSEPTTSTTAPMPERDSVDDAQRTREILKIIETTKARQQRLIAD